MESHDWEVQAGIKPMRSVSEGLKVWRCKIPFAKYLLQNEQKIGLEEWSQVHPAFCCRRKVILARRKIILVSNDLERYWLTVLLVLLHCDLVAEPWWDVRSGKMLLLASWILQVVCVSPSHLLAVSLELVFHPPSICSGKSVSSGFGKGRGQLLCCFCSMSKERGGANGCGLLTGV